MTPAWPILRSYDAGQLARIALPLGGIGTGTIGLGGRGDLRDFEVGNRPAKGFRPGQAMFLLRTAAPSGVDLRVLEGPLDSADYDGDMGSPVPTHGLPRFGTARFSAAYPFGQVELTDGGLAPEVTLQAFNPLVPTDVAASSLPVAVFRFRLRNPGAERLHVTVCGVLENFVGANGTDDTVGGNVNTAREAYGLVGVELSAPDLDRRAEAAGRVVLATEPVGVTSVRTGWAGTKWGYPLLDFWDDLLDDGLLDQRTSTAARPVAALTNGCDLGPGETRTLTFLVTWSFPNRRAWRSEEYGGIDRGQYTDEVVGNHYSTVWPDPWHTAVEVARQLPDLERRTVRAVESVVGSSAPAALREAALFNLSTLRSPTLFRVADGEFYGWEGVRDRVGSCFGTCTHVWAYEFVTSLWFADIGWSFRRTQYLRSTDGSGLMAFRAGLPVRDAQRWGLAAADGQMACLVHLYLDWRLSGDTEQLRRLWPAARRTLEFAWLPGSWDADQDGVMEGCQHNTMDVEYYGPNPQMGTWYLAALRAAAELAAVVGDHDFGARCDALYRRGAAWVDQHLFTGRYYRQQVRPVSDPSAVRPGLRHPFTGAEDLGGPDSQLGEGVLIDQLVGQYAARLAGLGSLLDPGQVATTLRHIAASNYRPDLRGHFNHMRGYALPGEAGTLMCSYPDGTRPAKPFPYFNEVMTGFEYTLAAGHVQDGDRDTAERIVTAVRDRFDGRRRNPFDEVECGRHYARAMASYSAYVAWSGVQWAATDGLFEIARTAPGDRYFWSTGTAAGEWRRSAADEPPTVTITVFEGVLPVRRIVVDGAVTLTRSPLTAGGHVVVRL